MPNSPLTSSPLPATHVADTLWHYTSPSSTFSILRSGEIWATSPRYQNDQTEAIYAWGIVKSTWGELRDSGLDQRGCELLELAFTENMGEAVQRSAFTLSASASPSVPHLWKNYAANETGFAIGLDTRFFWAPKYRLTQILGENKFNRALPVREGFFKVAYDPDEQRALAIHALTWLCEFWWRIGEVPGIYDPWGLYLHNAQFIVRSLLLIMKHPSYSEEEEVRFIAGRPIRDQDIAARQEDLAHLPLAALPFLGNDATLPGIPIAELVYGAKADPVETRALSMRLTGGRLRPAAVGRSAA